jgi:hypothetical protein
MRKQIDLENGMFIAWDVNDKFNTILELVKIYAETNRKTIER